MRAVAARATVAVLLVLVVAGGAPSAATALDRALQDRPDEQLGPQVHLLYVTPSDGPDRALDTSGRITGSVAT